MSTLPTSSAPMPEYYVTMHNGIVKGEFDFSITAHRILMMLLSQIDSREQAQFKPQYVRVADLKRLLGEPRGSLYTQCKEAVDDLIGQTITIEEEDGSYHGMTVFEHIRYLAHSGVITAQFSNYARPYLLQLERQFTSWQMRQTLPLTTNYAIRHYMLAKMVERKTRRHQQTFALTDYRRWMRLTDKYERFADLRRYVLEPSIEQVNDKTDVEVAVEVERHGRSAVGLTFIVERPAQQRASITQKVAASPDVAPHDQWLASLGPAAYDKTMTQAAQRAQCMGYTNDGSWTWKAGVETALRKIFREQNGNALP